MIVSDYFHGDSTRIGWIQHDCYREALRIIIDFASAKHREAEAVVNVRTELSDLRDGLVSFDHRTLQWLHDRMAASFRMQYCLNADLFTYVIPDPHTPAEITTFWFEFLRKELERVFACDDFNSLAKYSSPLSSGIKALSIAVFNRCNCA